MVKKRFNALSNKWGVDKGVRELSTWELTHALLSCFILQIKSYRDVDGEWIDDFVITPGRRNDSPVSFELRLLPGKMYVFDRAYNDFNLWDKIVSIKSNFVTRLKDCPRVRYLQVKVLHQKKNKDGVLYDGRYRPTTKEHAKKNIKLRYIIYRDPTSQKIFHFVCSDPKISGQTIADFYKRRWAVELLFRWLKGHLDIRRLSVKTKNAVRVLLAAAVLFQLLLQLKKITDQFKGTLWDLLRAIRAATIQKSLMDTGPPDGCRWSSPLPQDPQLESNQIKPVRPCKLEPRKRRPGPKVKYGPEVVHHLQVLWNTMNRICSKKMRAALPLWLNFYKEANHDIKSQLLSMAASTIDKKLNPYRGPVPKGKSTTRGLKMMMSKIPLKLLEGEIEVPGFTEMDTVAHCGDDIAGSYTHSITLTDLFSGWTENSSVWTKEAEQVQKKVKKLEDRLPFSLLGCAVDNGSEFMNQHLAKYFFDRPTPIDFVRRRAYKKNDNAHVEQKNYTHVRELFGYERFDNFELSVLMDEIYQVYWNPLNNYFIPSLKLISKERIGSKIKKKYDQPKTPCQRLLDSDKVSTQVKKQLRHNLNYKNPFFLKRELELKLKIFHNRVEELKRQKQMTGS